MPQKLSVDIETYSGYQLKDVGVYKYVEHPAFAILLFAYAFDDDDVTVIDLAQGEQLPGEVLDALMGFDDVTLHAHNAAFERTCINKALGLDMSPEMWHCTMVHAAMVGLPMKLADAAKVLKLADQKDTKGKALIKYFCQPCKPTKVNGQSTRNLPVHAPEKWAEFVEYCRQDVIVERKIKEAISFYEILPAERKLYLLDQHINDRGVLLDVPFIKNAIRIDADYKARLQKEAIEITGLQNPNSLPQLKAWLEAALNEANTDDLGICEAPVTITSLAKEKVTELLKTTDDETVERLLTIRQELSKTSNKKYNTMLAGIGADGRFRGLLQIYGAGRTGRWAGRLVQVQNLPKNDDIEPSDLEISRKLVAEGDAEMLELLFDNVPHTLSRLIRTAFVAAAGDILRIADAAQIEARILAWLANEVWRLDVFRAGAKIYEASAAMMFHIPVETIVKGHPNYKFRALGKVGELALGYQGAEGAIDTMDKKKEIPLSERKPLVTAWRDANRNIVKFWWAVQAAAITAVETGQRQTVKPGIGFYTKNDVLLIQLPSGRCLSYLRPQIRTNKFDKPALCYEGVDQDTKRWGRIDTYGGKLVENITQAIARDCLADAMTRINAAGYEIVLHVHDEVVIQSRKGTGSLAEVESIMSQPIPWAPGLPLGAEGFESAYYKK